MSDLEKALGILSEAEEALSTLMREALADQRYDDLAAVAEATQLLTDLVGSLESPSPQDKETGLSRGRTRRKRSSASGARGRDGYRADLHKLSDESLNGLWEALPEHV